MVDTGAHNRASAGLGAWLARCAPKRARGEMTVAIVKDAVIQTLNRKFRGINKATDVLSFPAEHGSGGRERRSGVFCHRIPGRGLPISFRVPQTPFLGDIVIARGVAAQQARALGHPLRTELRILALHGLLHLLGYDHDVDNGQMAGVEGRLRRRAGLPDGLIARSS